MELEKNINFTLEHAQTLYQTIADIIGEKNNMKIIANVKLKEGEVNGQSKNGMG